MITIFGFRIFIKIAYRFSHLTIYTLAFLFRDGRSSFFGFRQLFGCRFSQHIKNVRLHYYQGSWVRQFIGFNKNFF